MSVPNGTYTRTNSFGSDAERIMPRFYIESVKDELASQRENRAIYYDQERVELIMPGNPYNVPVNIVTDEHRERWPKQYAAFKAGHTMSAEGTPLEQWPTLSRSQVLELKAMNIMTVEHVANMADQACQRFMGGMRLRELAKAFLDDAHAGAELSRVTAENEKKDARISELEHKVTELSSLLNSVHSEMQNLKNAPNAIASHIPALSDPAEQMKSNPQNAGGSSLDNLPAPRRRGRPPKQVEAA